MLTQNEALSGNSVIQMSKTASFGMEETTSVRKREQGKNYLLVRIPQELDRMYAATTVRQMFIGKNEKFTTLQLCALCDTLSKMIQVLTANTASL
jgi:hypothetical protein